MTASKTNRVTNVQTPGEAPKEAQAPVATGGGAGPDIGTATPASATTSTASTAPSDPIDLEALRAHIREEERAIARDELRAELGQQIQAASTALSATTAAPAPGRSKADYRNMRAADIDPATLTAPVMTLDGYLCPPAPEAKK